MNAYINGGAAMAGHLTRPEAGGNAGQARPAPLFLAAVAASGLLLITLYGLGRVSPAALVAIPTTLFLAVYLGSMAGGRPGAARPGPLGRRARLGRGGGDAGLLRVGASAPRPGRGGRSWPSPRPVARGCAAAVAPSPDRPRTAAGPPPDGRERPPSAAAASRRRLRSDGTSTYDIAAPMIMPVSCTPGSTERMRPAGRPPNAALNGSPTRGSGRPRSSRGDRRPRLSIQS